MTGSELVGLLPLRVMTDAADYFLRKQQRSLGISTAEKVKIAVKSLGLDDLGPFDPNKRVIEFMIAADRNTPLLDLSLGAFATETASRVRRRAVGRCRLFGDDGRGLATMVANLSAHKRGWDDRWEEFSRVAERGIALQNQLELLVDADTAAFNAIMEAYGMPKGTEAQQQSRHAAIQDATKNAIEIPMRVAGLRLTR